MDVHSGHRQRLKNRFLTEGLDSFEPHNVLELLLFFGMPRADTNPIAHRLLDHFGSLSAVFDAPFETLIKVEGVGEHCATLIKLVPQAARKYQIDRCEDKILSSTVKIGNYLLPQYFGRTTETVCLLCLDNKFKALSCTILFEGSINAAAVSVRAIVQTALKFNSTGVVISHNHPAGVALPSDEDLVTTGRIMDALKTVGINLVDHIIVADDDFVSLRDSGFIK